MNKKMGVKRWLRIVGCLLIIFGSVSNVISSFALSSDKLNMFAQNNILFYDPTVSECSGDPKPAGEQITWIGDSYSVGARGIIESRFSGVDFGNGVDTPTSYIQVGKFVSSDTSSNPSGLKILRELAASAKLRKYLVFALGTNGGWTEDNLQEFVSIINQNNTIAVLMTSRIPSDPHTNDNNLIRNIAKANSNIYLADWANVYQENYFDDDPEKIHPVSNGGYQAWVDTIYGALPGESSITAGKNTNYAGETVWSESELASIEANKAIYQEAVREYNFPWQVMAVLHSMETGLQRYNPSNGQGVYQLYSYTDGGKNNNRFEPSDSISEEEFLRQTKIAAGVAVGMAGDLNQSDNVKKLFYQYNGTAAQYTQKAIDMGFTAEQANNGEGSMYVMNRYDAQRDPTSANMSKYWPGVFVADGVYDSNATSMVFGAFVKYEALGKSEVCSSNNGKIVDTAILLSWEGQYSHAKDDPKPEYVKAMKEVGNYQVPIGGLGVAPIGASCDQFVSTVMRYSGADPDFPTFGPDPQKDHMITHPEMYQQINHNNDISNLKPGDIFVTESGNGHIYLYIGEVNGEQSVAQASFNGETGEHYPAIPWFSDSGGNYLVFRRINY